MCLVRMKADMHTKISRKTNGTCYIQDVATRYSFTALLVVQRNQHFTNEGARTCRSMLQSAILAKMARSFLLRQENLTFQTASRVQIVSTTLSMIQVKLTYSMRGKRIIRRQTAKIQRF